MKLLKVLFRIAYKSILTLFVLAFFAIGIQYLSVSIYEFTPRKAFSGGSWHNPYQHVDTLELRANFHAHSVAWGKMTYGHNTSKEMVDAYKNRGYDIYPLSNYFMLDTAGKAGSDLFIPTYEHGLNIFKKHCIVLDPCQVSNYDYFLFQTPSMQQKVIEQIKENKGVVALAHPELSHGRSKEDLSYLNHYDLVEVLNHYRVSDDEWDGALSAGRLVYIIANDDSHQIDTTVMFRMWNVILPKERTKKAALDALKNGQSYGVFTDYCQQENKLLSCEIKGDKLQVVLTDTADVIEFIGQGGMIKKKVHRSAQGSYKLKKQDSYIRVVARNSQSALYLNPVSRYSDKVVLNSELLPQEKTLQTWLFRAFICCIELFLMWLIYRLWKRRKPKVI